MPAYPPLNAGTRITAGLIESAQWHFVFKQVDTLRTNNTITIDPELQFPLEGNAVYEVVFYAHPASTDSAGYRTNWTVPTGAAGIKECLGVDQGNIMGNAGTEQRMGGHQFSTNVGYGNRDSATNQFMTVERGLVTTAGAGIVGLNWAQISTNATAAKLAKGSYMTVQRLA